MNYNKEKEHKYQLEHDLQVQKELFIGQSQKLDSVVQEGNRYEEQLHLKDAEILKSKTLMKERESGLREMVRKQEEKLSDFKIQEEKLVGELSEIQLLLDLETSKLQKCKEDSDSKTAQYNKKVSFLEKRLATSISENETYLKSLNSTQLDLDRVNNEFLT